MEILENPSKILPKLKIIERFDGNLAKNPEKYWRILKNPEESLATELEKSDIEWKSVKNP